MKKQLSLFLALLMIFSAFSLSALAEETDGSDGAETSSVFEEKADETEEGAADTSEILEPTRTDAMSDELAEVGAESSKNLTVDDVITHVCKKYYYLNLTKDMVQVTDYHTLSDGNIVFKYTYSGETATSVILKVNVGGYQYSGINSADYYCIFDGENIFSLEDAYKKGVISDKVLDEIADMLGFSKNFPEVTKVESVATGMKLTWESFLDAAKYRVFVKNGSKWTKLGDTTALNFTHTAAVSGTSYTYTVRAIDKNGSYCSMYYTPGWTNTFISAPVISKFENTAAGVKITWAKPAGAVKFRVFKKDGSSWKKLGDTTAVNFTDEQVASDRAYTYTVRCLNADGTAYVSGYTSGKSTTFIAAPALSKVDNNNAGAVISWNRVIGASKYRVFYKTGSSGWKKLGDTAALSFTHKNPTVNTAYTYTVRCLSSDGKSYQSGFDATGLTNTMLASPTITKLVPSGNTVHLKWNAVKGAEKYRVYRKKKGDSSWTTLGDTTNTYGYDWNVDSGTTYLYTVRCLSADAKTHKSGFQSGWSITYCDMPIFTKAEAVTGTRGTITQYKFTWGKVTGAPKYRVFVKESGGSWEKLTDTTATTYTYNTGKELAIILGYTYKQFAVRVVSSDGKTYLSDFYPLDVYDSGSSFYASYS